jgi:hypothetical protein
MNIFLYNLIIYVACLTIGLFLNKFHFRAMFVFAFVALISINLWEHSFDNWLSRIDPGNMAVFGFFISYFIFKYAAKASFKRLDSQKKLVSKFFIIFMLLVPYFIHLKDYYLVGSTALGGTAEPIYLFQVVRDTLLCTCLILLFKICYDTIVLRAVNLAIIYSSIAIGLSIMFPDSLGMMGCHVGSRYSGLLNINPNAAGGYCAIVLAYCLSKMEDLSNNGPPIKLYLLCSCLMFLAIMNTGSRTALLSVALVVILYVIRNMYGKKMRMILCILVIIVGFCLGYQKFGDLMQTRLLRGEVVIMAEQRAIHRYVYLQDLYKNPHYLLFGNTKELSFAYDRDVHNYYLYLLYKTGLPVLMFFLLYNYKLYKNLYAYKRNKESFRSLYILIAFWVMSLTISHPLNYTLFILLGLASGIPLHYAEN